MLGLNARTGVAGHRLLGLVLIASWIWLAIVLIGQYDSVKRYAGLATYSRVAAWLRSAECTQKRSVFLAVCGADGTLVPIEDASPADDRGHTLLANGLALLKSRPVTRMTLIRLNLFLNAGALVLLSVVLFMIGCRLAAVLSVWAGIPWGIPGAVPGADALAAFFAAYCLALVPVITAVHLLTARRSALRVALSCSLCGMALTGAILLRQPIGMAGVITTSGTVVAMMLGERWSVRQSVAGGVCILVAVLATQVTPAMLAVRGFLFGIPPGRLAQSHGVSHNLYIGLGTHPNPWGIKWDDAVAAQAVARVDPSVAYVSPQYYKILWRLYLDALRDRPLAALKIYLQKASETFRFDNAIWKLLVGLALVTTAWWNAPAGIRIPVYTAVATLGLTVLVLLQGVLAIPLPGFFYPAAFGANVLLFLVGDIALRMIEIMAKDRGAV